MSKEKVSARAWIIVSIVWIGYVVVNLANFSIGIMMPDIQAELSLTVNQTGWLSASSWILKAVFSIPIALLLSRFNAKNIIQAVFAIVSVGLLLQGFAQNFVMLFLGRALVYGVAAAILAPLAVVKIKLIPKERMAGINGIENFTGPLGQVLGTAVVPFIIATMGTWRNTMILMGVLAIIVTVVWSVCCKKEDGMSEANTTGKSQKVQFLAPLKEACSHRTVWLLALGWWGTGLIWNAMYSYWPTFVQNSYGIGTEVSGVILGILPIASIIGSLTSPKIADKIGYDKPMIFIWGFILPVAYFCMMITSNIPLLCVAVFVAGYGAYAFVPIAFTSIYKIKGISPQAVSIGMAMIFTTNGVGGALGGTLSASLSQSMGLEGALKICCLFPLIFGILTLFLPETGRKAAEREQLKG